MKRKRAACLIPLLLAAAVLNGCSQQQQRILEKLGVISAVGYDKADGEELLGTLVLPNFIETGKEQIDVLNARGRTSKELRFNMSRLSERKLVSGQIRVVLYGEKLAQQGILPLSDTLFRDAEVGSQIHLAVVEGRASSYFLKRFPDKPTIDLYLYRLIRKEIEENSIPRTNLHRFLHDAYDNGKDPVLPYLRLGKQDVILDGLAVFHDDKMVGRLSADEARMLAYLSGNSATGEFDAELPEKTSHSDTSHAVLVYLNLKHKVDVQKVDGKPKFAIQLTVDGGVTEYTGFEDLEKPEGVAKLERFFAEKMQTEANAMLHKCQREFKSDPFGFGELYRAKGYLKDVTDAQWHKLYEKADIKVQVKVNILQTGMIH